jgi:hypothetical protein
MQSKAEAQEHCPELPAASSGQNEPGRSWSGRGARELFFWGRASQGKSGVKGVDVDVGYGW